MFKRIRCKVLGHKWRKRKFSQGRGYPFVSIHECRRCGDRKWGRRNV